MKKDFIVSGGDVRFFSGIEAYTQPLLDRIKPDVKVIYQIIDAKKVAKFHDYMNDFVIEAISKRVEFGIQIKNLITYESKDLEIEISNPDTLKETRYLPKEIDFEGVFAVYGDSVSFCNLSEEALYANISKDKVYAKSAKFMFDALWEKSTQV